MKKIPFSFVLDNLHGLDTELKPMFGSYAIYSGQKIMFILREKDNHTDDNGVWLATEREHHPSIQAEFPSLRSIRMFGGQTTWLNMPAEADDFEESVLAMCELALKRDPRIGKIPDSKKKKTPKPKAAAKAKPAPKKKTPVKKVAKRSTKKKKR